MSMRAAAVPALSLLLSLALPAPAPGQDPAPSLTIRREGNGALRLDYTPGFTTGGTAMLHHGADPETLTGTHARLLPVPATPAGPLTWDVSALATGERGFFTVTEFPEFTPEDFVYVPDRDEEPDPVYDYRLDTLEGPYYPLSPGGWNTLRFRMLDGATGELASVNGVARLALRDAAGVEATFPHSLDPPTVPVVNGEVDAVVTLYTDGPTEGYWLDVVEILPQGAGPVPRDVSGKTFAEKGTINGKKILFDHPCDPLRWHHPLNSPLEEPRVWKVTGSFGEWRPSDDGGGDVPGGSGRAHTGMDLSAPPGDSVVGKRVYPVKRGVVSHITDHTAKNHGHYITVVHSDGTAARYLHVDPMVRQHQVVNTWDVLGTVSNLTGRTPPHLHLELRRGVPWTTFSLPGGYMDLPGGTRPGRAFDPGMENTWFDTPLVKRGSFAEGGNDRNAPVLKALYLWGKDPAAKSKNLFEATSPASPPVRVARGESCQALVAQLVDEEEGQRMVPAHVEFTAENAVTREWDEPKRFQFGTARDHGPLSPSETDVARLFQDSRHPYRDYGYVRRKGNEMPEEAQYQFWFKWNTAPYREHKKGPRRVRITAQDRAGRSSATGEADSGVFTFGPELTAPLYLQPRETPESRTLTAYVRSFMGPFPSSMRGEPEDTVTVTLDQAGLPSWDAEFEGEGEGDARTRVLTLTGHDRASEKPLKIRLTPRPGAPVPGPAERQTLVLTARSAVFPDIMHEVKVSVSALPAVTLHSVSRSVTAYAVVNDSVSALQEKSSTDRDQRFTASCSAAAAADGFSLSINTSMDTEIQGNNPAGFRLSHSSTSRRVAGGEATVRLFQDSECLESLSFSVSTPTDFRANVRQSTADGYQFMSMTGPDGFRIDAHRVSQTYSGTLAPGNYEVYIQSGLRYGGTENYKGDTTVNSNNITLEVGAPLPR